jgi:hypothetical protein
MANAIFDDIGVRISELPLSAEKIYATLQSGGVQSHVHQKEKATKPTPL